MNNIFEICTINLNEGDGRQTIYYNLDDCKLYTSAGDIPVDNYTYSSIDDAVNACDIMWGSSDIVGVWELEWIEHD